MKCARFWSKLGLFGSLIAAWTAMMGSLYFSEVSGFTPCTLCWYQRILMYPLAGLLAFGILRRDSHLPHLVLPFSLLGQGVSVYHFLLQKTPYLGSPSSCGVSVTCTTVWIDWFGVVTIPLLAMAGFMVITTGMLIVIAADSGGAGAIGPYRWPRWPVPLIALVFVGLYLAGSYRAGKVYFSLPAMDIPMLDNLPLIDFSADPTATPGPTPTPSSMENGETLYSQLCASCHGVNGEGADGLGTALTNSPYVSGLTDSELTALIRNGRAAGAPDNRTGIAMPGSGDSTNLTDEQIVDIMNYIKSWQ